jgi:hypothetical protein
MLRSRRLLARGQRLTAAPFIFYLSVFLNLLHWTRASLGLLHKAEYQEVAAAAAAKAERRDAPLTSLNLFPDKPLLDRDAVGGKGLRSCVLKALNRDIARSMNSL